MSGRWAEDFESDSAGWGTAVLGTSCVWNRTKLTSEVEALITVPSSWAMRCLHMHSNLGDDAYNSVNVASTDLPISYWRFELAAYSLGLSSSEKVTLFKLLDASANTAVQCFWSRQVAPGSAHRFRLECYHDGSLNIYESLTPPVQFSVHRIELKWDATNNVWAWRLDGVNQPNDQDASDPVESEGTLTGSHVTGIKTLLLGTVDADSADKTETIYFDRLGVDDADWIGAADVQIPTVQLADFALAVPSLSSVALEV